MNLLEADSSILALKAAQKTFKKRFPGESFVTAAKKLDRKKCEPAVLRIGKSSKKGLRQDLVLLHARDINAMILFHEHIRPNAPAKVKTSRFFFNSMGSSLGKDVWYYLKATCKKAGVVDVTFGALRRALEVENFLQGSKVVSSHLGHTLDMAKEHYVTRDSRHAISAANRILGMIEDLAAEQEVQLCLFYWSQDSIHLLKPSSHPIISLPIPSGL